MGSGNGSGSMAAAFSGRMWLTGGRRDSGGLQNDV